MKIRLETYKMATSILLKFQTLKCDISRTIWRIEVSDGSLFCIFHALSFEVNLCFDRTCPLKHLSHVTSIKILCACSKFLSQFTSVKILCTCSKFFSDVTSVKILCACSKFLSHVTSAKILNSCFKCICHMSHQ